MGDSRGDLQGDYWATQGASSPLGSARFPQCGGGPSSRVARNGVAWSRFWALGEESSEDEMEPVAAPDPVEDVRRLGEGPSPVTLAEFLDPAWQVVCNSRSRRRRRFAPGGVLRGSRCSVRR